jgi:hypothetical protein
VKDAVDVVTMVDSLEHLSDDTARAVLRQAEEVAARRVVVVTPRGEFPQEGYDAFGMGGQECQRHRSTWDVGDLTGLGYRVVVLKGYHDARNTSFVEAFGEDGAPIDALVAWKDVG